MNKVAIDQSTSTISINEILSCTFFVYLRARTMCKEQYVALNLSLFFFSANDRDVAIFSFPIFVAIFVKLYFFVYVDKIIGSRSFDVLGNLIASMQKYYALFLLKIDQDKIFCHTKFIFLQYLGW